MLSRRSVRIKVMQLLYAANRDQDISLDETRKKYWDGIEQSKELLHFSLYLLLQITRSAQDDYESKKNKYLPSDEDKSFQPHLWTNPGVQKIVQHEGIDKRFTKYEFPAKIDQDILRKIYTEFAKEDEYNAYWKSKITPKSTEKILLELFKFCRASESFIEMLSDNYVNWEDDKSIIIGTVKKIIKSLHDKEPLDLDAYDADDETVKEFGETLLLRTFEEDKTLLESIKPVLKNWDSERVAIIDLIYLKMALCELLYFETIPTKVTLNEYVELAKAYSTPKSKEFVNGILDTLVADLTKSKKIVKKGRGLME